MQQRYHIAYAPDFISAHKLKVEQQEKNPKNFFQIRARKDKFELVGRVSAKVVLDKVTFEPPNYTKRKKPKKGYGRGPYTPLERPNDPRIYKVPSAT